MRRKLALLMIGTWLAVAGVVATAAPAAAHPGSCVSGERRNVGGTGPAGCSCWLPPGLAERRNVGGTGEACGCSMFPVLERRNVGGTGEACGCSPVLQRRNVGGTGPADCPPGLALGWLFPRLRTG